MKLSLVLILVFLAAIAGKMGWDSWRESQRPKPVQLTPQQREQLKEFWSDLSKGGY